MSQPAGVDAAARQHEPMMCSTGRYGSWGACLCGKWQSRTWTTVTGVHIEFGKHLLAVHRAAHP